MALPKTEEDQIMLELAHKLVLGDMADAASEKAVDLIERRLRAAIFQEFHQGAAALHKANEAILTRWEELLHATITDVVSNHFEVKKAKSFRRLFANWLAV